MGEQQAKDPNAVPLADFISETMHLLSAQTDAKEILVKVYPLRFAGDFNSDKFTASSINSTRQCPATRNHYHHLSAQSPGCGNGP